MAKNLRNIIFAGVASAALLLTGCTRTEIKYSEAKTETAIVADKQHKNSYTWFIIAGKVYVPITVSQKDEIKFKGKINFDINNKEIYNRFKEGDSAQVTYQETYLDTYKKIDGLEKQISEEIIGYKFIDAQHSKK